MGGEVPAIVQKITAYESFRQAYTESTSDSVCSDCVDFGERVIHIAHDHKCEVSERSKTRWNLLRKFLANSIQSGEIMRQASLSLALFARLPMNLQQCGNHDFPMMGVLALM